MTQITKAVAQGILGGQGYTDNEVRQLAHYWLAKNGGEDTPQAGAESYPPPPENPAVFDKGRFGVAWNLAQLHAYADTCVDAALRARGAVPSGWTLVPDVDPLQGAANWLVDAHSALEVSTLAGKLSISYARAKGQEGGAA